MALIVGNDALTQAYKDVKAQAYQIKTLAESRSALLDTDIAESALRAALDNLTSMRTLLVAKIQYAGGTRLTDEGKRQESAAYEANTEYVAMKAALDAAIQELETSLPAERTFTPSQTAALKTALDALSATMTVG